MKAITLAVILICAVPFSVAAQGPGNRPGGGPRSERREGGPGRPWREPSEKEWEEIAKFLDEKMPNAWKAYQAQPESAKKRLWRRIFIMRYNMIQHVEDQSLRDARLKMLKDEDEIFGLARDYGAATEPAQKQAIEAQLREKLRSVIQDELKARAEHIKRLEAALKAERERLDADQQNPDKLVEDRVKHIEDRGAELKPLPPPLPPSKSGPED